MEHLLFRLYGPMASWGEVAVGEVRHSATYPSKSALAGLIGAALGIAREQEDELLELANTYVFAVKVLVPGQPLRDYHTTQVPRSVGKTAYRTRREEIVLGEAHLGTILSTRDYRTDSCVWVAARTSDRARYSLSQLMDALKRPKFHLYLGRKSCPLAAPLAPQLIDADGYHAAFENYKPGKLLPSQHNGESDARWLPSGPVVYYYWEGSNEDFASAGEHFVPDQVQVLTRRDQPRSRKRWQFSPRQENLYVVKEGS